MHSLSGIAVLFPLLEQMRNWVIKEKRSWRDPMRTSSYHELNESRESGNHTDAVIDRVLTVVKGDKSGFFLVGHLE